MIKLYGFEECGPGRQVKHLLEKFNIEYEYIDVLKNNIDFDIVPMLELDDGRKFKGLSVELTKYLRKLGRKYRGKK